MGLIKAERASGARASALLAGLERCKLAPCGMFLPEPAVQTSLQMQTDRQMIANDSSAIAYTGTLIFERVTRSLCYVTRSEAQLVLCEVQAVLQRQSTERST